jgi:hypothetical protein
MSASGNAAPEQKRRPVVVLVRRLAYIAVVAFIVATVLYLLINIWYALALVRKAPTPTRDPSATRAFVRAPSPRRVQPPDGQESSSTNQLTKPERPEV